MKDNGFTIEVTNIGARFSCKGEKSLLSGMESQQKKAIKIGCRGGGCGICKIRILSGQYEAKKMSIKHITSEQAKKKVALSCRIFPRSDMNIESIEDINECTPNT